MIGNNNIILDTNILIYHLQKGGSEYLSLILDNNCIISVISEIELLGYHKHTKQHIDLIRSFLNTLTIVELNSEIKETSIRLKRKYKIKTPDSIIAATAIYMHAPLISADKGFEKVPELILINYSV